VDVGLKVSNHVKLIFFQSEFQIIKDKLYKSQQSHFFFFISLNHVSYLIPHFSLLSFYLSLICGDNCAKLMCKHS